MKLKNISVNFSVNGDQIISGGNDKQVIIWKTNFDQQPAEAAKAKSPKKTAKKKSALGTGFLFLSCVLERILVESIYDVCSELNSLQKMCVCSFIVRSSFNNKKEKPEKEERIVADIGPPLGEPDQVSRGLKENETEVEQLEERQMAPQVERTMRQMIQQMDVLTSTVSSFENK